MSALANTNTMAANTNTMAANTNTMAENTNRTTAKRDEEIHKDLT